MVKRWAAGLSTKIHLAVDRRGRPLSVLLTAGQAGASPQLMPLLDAIRVHDGGPGRPRKKPDMLIADKAYARDVSRETTAGGFRRVEPNLGQVSICSSAIGRSAACRFRFLPSRSRSRPP
ncbi:hypothetical protein ACTI_21250 [Actinoplanes sp. OR16]|nr:hypothetical protein ACTI_21250 [Actinoplanes sp. OR16]